MGSSKNLDKKGKKPLKDKKNGKKKRRLEKQGLQKTHRPRASPAQTQPEMPAEVTPANIEPPKHSTLKELKKRLTGLGARHQALRVALQKGPESGVGERLHREFGTAEGVVLAAAAATPRVLAIEAAPTAGGGEAGAGEEGQAPEGEGQEPAAPAPALPEHEGAQEAQAAGDAPAVVPSTGGVEAMEAEAGPLPSTSERAGTAPLAGFLDVSAGGSGGRDVDALLRDMVSQRRSRHGSPEEIAYYGIGYKLGEMTIVPLSRGRAGVRFDLLRSGGSGLQQYYLVFSADRHRAACLRVLEHSLPFFLPLKELEREAMPQGPLAFLQAITRVLHSLASKSDQVQRLRDGHGSRIQQLTHSVGFSLMEFVIHDMGSKVSVSLAYADPRVPLPTRALVVAWPGGLHSPLTAAAARKGRGGGAAALTQRLPRAEAALKSLALPEAYPVIIAALRRCVAPPSASPSPAPEAPPQAPPPPPRTVKPPPPPLLVADPAAASPRPDTTSNRKRVTRHTPVDKGTRTGSPALETNGRATTQVTRDSKVVDGNPHTRVDVKEEVDVG